MPPLRVRASGVKPSPIHGKLLQQIDSDNRAILATIPGGFPQAATWMKIE
jgi:hypothetical protein